MAATRPARTSVFISYSHKDQRWLDELKVHLKPLNRDQAIDIWDDSRIKPGSRWKEEIRGAIQQARAAVLLVSPNFMASDFIARGELPPILRAADADGVMILPVIVRSSRFERDEQLNCFQTVNNPAQPLINMPVGKRDIVFEKLAETIQGILGRDQPEDGGSKSARVRASNFPDSANQQASKRAAKGLRVPPASALRKQQLIGSSLEQADRRPRIYISAPNDHFLSDHAMSIKRDVIRALYSSGLQPQEFGVSGLPVRRGWDFDAAIEVMSNCQGVFIFALARWRFSTPEGMIAMPTEYAHFEGALALSRGLPTFILAEHGVAERGIAYQGGRPPGGSASSGIRHESGRFIVWSPEDAETGWVQSPIFVDRFQAWLAQVRHNHKDVFLSYGSAQKEAATGIRHYLESLGISVMDWTDDFMPGRSFLEDAKSASARCATSVVLLGDDRNDVHSDLWFELGYFVKARGMDRVLVISEAGAKIPSDFAGWALLRVENFSKIESVQSKLRAFLHARL